MSAVLCGCTQHHCTFDRLISLTAACKQKNWQACTHTLSASSCQHISCRMWESPLLLQSIQARQPRRCLHRAHSYTSTATQQEEVVKWLYQKDYKKYGAKRCDAALHTLSDPERQANRGLPGAAMHHQVPQWVIGCPHGNTPACPGLTNDAMARPPHALTWEQWPQVVQFPHDCAQRKQVNGGRVVRRAQQHLRSTVPAGVARHRKGTERHSTTFVQGALTYIRPSASSPTLTALEPRG
jgi:hypothetical protein